MEEGAVTRDVYLPSGTWRDGNNMEAEPVTGPTWIRDYQAPLFVLPYFVKDDNWIFVSGIKTISFQFAYYVVLWIGQTMKIAELGWKRWFEKILKKYFYQNPWTRDEYKALHAFAQDSHLSCCEFEYLVDSMDIPQAQI